MNADGRKWSALIAGYLLFVGSAVLVFEAPPLLEAITADIPMSDVQIGWLQGVIALPAVLLALPGGSLLDRFDSRAAGIASGMLMLTGNILFNLSGDYWLMLFSRFLIGVGVIIINLVSARMITLWFPRHQRGRALSVFHTAWPLTAGVAYSTFVWLARASHWRSVVLGVSFFVLGMALIFIILAPRDPEREADPEPPRIRRLLKLPAELWLNAFLWLCFTAGMISVLTFGAKFLAGAGMDYGRGSFTVGLLMWVAAPGSLIAGFIIDRWGSLRFHIAFFGSMSASFLLLFTLGADPVITMIFAGSFAAFTPIAVYALPGLIVHPRRLGLAFGVILTFSNFGNTFGPVITGWLSTLTRSYGAGMMGATAFLFISAACGLFVGAHRLHETNAGKAEATP